MISRQIQSILVAAATVAGVFSAATPSFAIAPTLVVGCEQINAPGFYEIESPITTNVVGPCIEIAASNVTLSIQANITGDGTHGTGIVIDHGSAHVVVRGNHDSGAPNGGVIISGFDIGLEDAQGGNVVGDFQSNSNHTSGILLMNADAEICDDINASNNGHDGIHIVNSAGERLNSIVANTNGTYGFWLDGASHSLIDQSSANGSGTTDFEIGSPGGTPASPGNMLVNDHAYSAMFGIVIEKGSTGNIVTRSGVPSGKTADSVADALDNNSSCKGDLWFNDFFAKRKPGCVH